MRSFFAQKGTCSPPTFSVPKTLRVLTNSEFRVASVSVSFNDTIYLIPFKNSDKLTGALGAALETALGRCRWVSEMTRVTSGFSRTRVGTGLGKAVIYRTENKFME